MRVCIIGAGVSGLVAAKYAISSGFQCDVLEAKSDYGGVWVYSENPDINDYGIQLCSPMYPSLWTNLPKELMSFPDLKIENEKSFVKSEDVLEFLHKYAKHFKVEDKIKLNRLVLKVEPLNSTQWQVTSIDKPSKKEYDEIYDSVMVCSGIHNEPVWPNIPGRDLFKGEQLHSYSYRSAKIFENKRVLVLGASSSAFDVVKHASEIAEQVVVSHHNKLLTGLKDKPKIIEKPDIKRIVNSDEVEFVDGSTVSFDLIVYCTGYKRSYPFLTKKCGLSIEDYHIKPLYKDVICIENPKLCFINITDQVATWRLADLQARFYMKYLSGQMELPSREEMLKDSEEILKKRIESDEVIVPRHYHSIRFYQDEYFKDLAVTANVEEVPSVIGKLWLDIVMELFGNTFHFRENKYEIIDDSTFNKTKT